MTNWQLEAATGSLNTEQLRLACRLTYRAYELSFFFFFCLTSEQNTNSLSQVTVDKPVIITNIKRISWQPKTLPKHS